MMSRSDVAHFACDQDGCERVARWGLRVDVPPEGMALDTVRPYSITLGIYFCDQHYQDLRFHSILSKLAPVFVEMSFTTGNPLPDFSRSRLHAIKIPDRRYTDEELGIKNHSLEFGHYVARGS